MTQKIDTPLDLAELRQLNKKLAKDTDYSPRAYLDKLTQLRGGIDNPQLLAEIEMGLGGKYARSGQSALAFQHLKKGEQIYESLPDELQDLWWVGVMHNRYGLAYEDTLDFEQALHHHVLAVEANREIENEEAVRGGLLNIGHMLLNLGAGEKAIEYVKQATTDPQKYPIITALAHGIMGRAYELVDDFELSKKHYENAFYATLESDYPLAYLCEVIDAYLNQDELEEAEKLLAIAHGRAAQNELIGYAQITMYVAEAQIAAAQNWYDQARSKCENALELAIQADNLLDQGRVKLQQAHILFLEMRFDACQQFLETLTTKGLPAYILIKADKLLLKLYEITEQWELAYRLVQQRSAAQLFTQSRIQSIEQLIDLRRHERELRKKNAESIKLHTEKDELFQIVAHDLKNPLSSALATIELLTGYGDMLPPEGLEKRHERIYKALLSALDIISQLTMMVEAESNDRQYVFEEFSALDLVTQVVEENTPLANAKQQQLGLGKGVAVTMYGNRLWVRQILSNLVSNAIKYSLSGSTTHVTMSLDSAKDRIIIRVEDEGGGMSPDDINKAFSKFTKLSSAPTGDESSMGLGLYISKVLTHRLGGTISVMSEGKGFGCVFALALPIRAELS